MLTVSHYRELGLLRDQTLLCVPLEWQLKFRDVHMLMVFGVYARRLEMATRGEAVSLSQRELGRLTGFDWKTIRAKRRKLVALGVFVSVGETGQGREPSYRINWEAFARLLREISLSNMGKSPSVVREKSLSTEGNLPQPYKEEEVLREVLEAHTEGARTPAAPQTSPNPNPPATETRLNEPRTPPPQMHPSVRPVEPEVRVPAPAAGDSTDVPPDENDWIEFSQVARLAKMRSTSVEDEDNRRRFFALPFPERIKAKRGIDARLERGAEYARGFVPTMENYLRKKLWEADVRLEIAPKKPAVATYARAELEKELAKQANGSGGGHGR